MFVIFCLVAPAVEQEEQEASCRNLIHAIRSSYLILLGGGLAGLVTFLEWCISPFVSV